MGNGNKTRRLAAVLAADVVGFSRMMSADEAGTYDALKRHHSNDFDPSVKEHGGRIVKLMGDGTLVEFTSAYDAVSCALEVQEKLFHSRKPNEITLRIGVNLGDVIIDGDDIFGDGVNIAARLEPMADPGGICISSIVNESVAGRIAAPFRDAGIADLKNIERAIQVWKWTPDQQQKTTNRPQRESISKSTQASVAVLPFLNMSGDPEQEYFSDGISEDIITDLSKVGALTVISRNSSFAYKGKAIDARGIAEDLKVGAILEGTVRRSHDRVRISAQLIDAATGANIWADRFDRTIDDIFATQDEVALRIVEALKVSVMPANTDHIADAPSYDVEAHDLMLRARKLLFSSKKDRRMFERTLWLLDRATALDPNFAEAFAGKSMAHSLDAQNGWTGNAEAMETAMQLAEIATKKNPRLPYAQYVLANQAFWRGDLARAKKAAETALLLNPNYALALGSLALINICAGNAPASLPLAERAMRLDPEFSQQYLHFLGTAYLVMGKYEIAAASFQERIRLVPETDLTRGLLISTLGHLGRVDSARRVYSELCTINPNYSFESHLSRLPFADPTDAEHLVAGYSKAKVEN